MQLLGGVPKIATGSYTGTGTYGADNPCSLTFPFSPKLWGIVSIGSAGSSQYCAQGSNVVVGKPTGTVYFNPGGISSNLEQAMSWSGNTVRWYNTSREWYQLNALGATYYYFAFS